MQMITTTRLIDLKVLLFIVLAGVSGMAHSIEEPQYEVLQSIDGIEIRQYQAVVQAVTTLPGTSHTMEGFKRLAGFIFGGNNKEQKIAMTAPVQETLGENSAEMAFTMPNEYRLGDLPTPTDSRVSLHNVPARTVAVVKFSGWATQSRTQRFERELRAVLTDTAIKIIGTASLNQYNPPWTLPFLRRNEVMIEVALPS
jgi:hypothetical protein